MRKPGLVSLAISACLAVGSAAQAETLRLLTWGSYAPDNIIELFEKETGITVEVTFSNNEDMISKLRATGGGGFDLAQPSHDRIHAAQLEYDIYRPMDLSKLDLSAFDQNLLQAVKDNTTIGGEVYSVPHHWGTSGLVVNKARAPNLKGFRDLCSSDYQGRISMRLKRTILIGMGYAMGEDPFGAYSDLGEYERIINAAADRLIDCKKNVKTYWTGGDDLSNLLRSGEIVASDAWDGTAFKLHTENPDINFVVPRTGALGWIDTFTLPRKSRAEEAAYKWINFVMRPDIVRLMSANSGYVTAHKDGGQLVPDNLKAAFNDAFTPADVANIKWFANIPPGIEDLEGKVLERIKAAQ